MMRDRGVSDVLPLVGCEPFDEGEEALWAVAGKKTKKKKPYDLSSILKDV